MGAAVWTIFAIIPSWIAWGAGPREFSGDGLWLLSVVGLDFQTLGRTIFGLSALFLWLCTALVWRAWLATLAPPARIGSVLALIVFATWLLWARHLEPRAIAGESEQDRLSRYIALKHDDLDLEASEENPFLQTRAEPWIKLSRARLAAARTAPVGARVRVIPQAASAPIIDGRIDRAEWQGALRLPLNPASGRAKAMLLAHGGKLYVAAEAPRDRTETGFDQMHFYFHVDLSPAFENERVFVSRGRDVTALRTVRLARMRHGDTEWHVLSQIEGESSVTSHRQFELELDRAEAGLASGAPFPFFIDVEGDPLRDAAGKFKARVTEGELGSRGEPLWARIAAPNEAQTLPKH